MANRERGEVSLVVGDRTYILRPTLTAYCSLEDKMEGKTHARIMREAGLGDARSLRALIWSYLQAKHADEIDTFEKAGELIDECGIAAAQKQLELLNEINAPPEQKEKKAKDDDPPPAQALNGATSTSQAGAPA